jgi:tRNA(Arg) A34 adenosine deaminase TadA
MQTIESINQKFVKSCLKLADAAKNLGEVPVGAVIVLDGKIIAKAYNTRESKNNPLGHAEIDVIRKAAKKLGRWRLSDCTLYVTLEPCLMCAGAIVQSRIGTVVYGAKDPKAGAVESLYAVLADKRLNHRPIVQSGVLADECTKVLKDFFSQLRKKRR